MRGERYSRSVLLFCLVRRRRLVDLLLHLPLGLLAVCTAKVHLLARVGLVVLCILSIQATSASPSADALTSRGWRHVLT